MNVMPRVLVEYTKFFGGLDLSNPLFSIKPGFLLDCVNYEPAVFGGYTLIDGYERFDGHTSPSSGSYYVMPCSITGTIAVGDTVTGNTSAAIGNVLQVNSGELIIGRVTGTFGASEAIKIGGSTVATTTGASVLNGGSTIYLDAVYHRLAANDLRTDISAVPGSGSILGVFMYQNTVYAFRNNAGGTAAVMHKTTASGWSAVTMPYEISFTTGSSQPAVGDTINGQTSGATAVVRRVLTRTGAWSGTAVGTLVVDTVTGTWQNGENIRVGATVKAVASSTCNQITLQPGGRYEVVIGNFYGQTDSTRVYGCDGKNPGFEFDGTYYVPIHTGMTADTPSHVAIHKKHLFFSFNSSVQHSSIGDPYGWSAVTGSAEIATGENVTGFNEVPGEVLIIWTRNITYQLLGSSTADWKLNIIAAEMGAIPYTTQSIGMAYGMDDRGLIQVSQTLNYGNFEHSTISRIIQSYIDQIRPNIVASGVYRKRNQYRLFCSDGTGIIMAVENGKVTGYTKIMYPDPVACFWSGEDSTGQERAFFGSTDGMVYETMKGTAFDDARRDAFVYLPYNTSRTPRYRKRYRKIVLEMVSQGYSEISFFPEFSYGDTDVSSHPLLTQISSGKGGRWDVSTWDTFYYDSKMTDTPEFSIAGTGNNLSIIFYSRSYIDAGHTLNGAMIHYSVRRISR